jgi:hypothetical protein
MSNNDSLIIQSGEEIISHTASQSDVIVFDEEKRQKLIQILRQIPAYIDVAKKLTEGKTYQAIITPEVLKRIKEGSARLDKIDDGLWSTTIRDVKTGRYIDRVNLKEITPELLSSLNQLAIQQTLANIVHRLEAIDEKITDILQGQVNDRLAEVESGIHIYEQAVVASDPDVRRELLVSAIQTLNMGRNKLIKSADFSFIDELPRTKLRMFFSLKWNIHKYVRSKAESVWKQAHAIVQASRCLVMAYSELNEPDTLRVSLEQVESEVKVFQDKMGEIVNWLSPTSNWRASLTTISQGVLPNVQDLDDIPQKTIVVEFQPKEIAPPEGV